MRARELSSERLEPFALLRQRIASTAGGVWCGGGVGGHKALEADEVLRYAHYCCHAPLLSCHVKSQLLRMLSHIQSNIRVVHGMVCYLVYNGKPVFNFLTRFFFNFLPCGHSTMRVICDDPSRFCRSHRGASAIFGPSFLFGLVVFFCFKTALLPCPLALSKSCPPRRQRAQQLGASRKPTRHEVFKLLKTSVYTANPFQNGLRNTH